VEKSSTRNQDIGADFVESKGALSVFRLHMSQNQVDVDFLVAMWRIQEEPGEADMRLLPLPFRPYMSE